jgi:hypothetical protein
LAVTAIALGAALTACGNNSPADSFVTTVCGQTMWSGEGHLYPESLRPPPAGMTAMAPARSELPPSGGGGLPFLFRVSARCDHGVVLRVVAPPGFHTYSIARAADGAITAVALAETGNGTGTLTIEAFTDGRLTGYLSGRM